MLAMIYLTVTAKPVPLRRLLCLFVVAFIFSYFASIGLGAKDARHVAAAVATIVTLLAWSSPLARLASYALCRRSVGRPNLLGVSGVVQLTYCVIAVSVLSVAIGGNGGEKLAPFRR